MGHRLATDEPTVVEQPPVLAVKLLIAVVRQDRGVDLVGDAQNETVAASDGSRRRGDELVGLDRLFELGGLLGVDPVTERRVNDHGDQGFRVITAVRRDRFVELFEAGHGSALSGQIRAVDDDVLRHNPASQASPGAPIYDPPVFTAVLWDFGGVILTSPFEAFNHYEAGAGLPRDFIRSVNSTNPHTNAWARLERNDISPLDFDDAFAADARRFGYEVRGSAVLALLAGEIRPRMAAALHTVKAAGFKTACLTNNVVGGDGESSSVGRERSAAISAVMERFDVIVESSKVGVRKPEPRFYEIACELLGVVPAECVFLDDLGINLKPAAAMGMHTIKVVDPDIALDHLAKATGLMFT